VALRASLHLRRHRDPPLRRHSDPVRIPRRVRVAIPAPPARITTETPTGDRTIDRPSTSEDRAAPLPKLITETLARVMPSPRTTRRRGTTSSYAVEAEEEILKSLLPPRITVIIIAIIKKSVSIIEAAAFPMVSAAAPIMAAITAPSPVSRD